MPELPNDLCLRIDVPVGVSLKLREHLHTFVALKDVDECAAQLLRETIRAFPELIPEKDGGIGVTLQVEAERNGQDFDEYLQENGYASRDDHANQCERFSIWDSTREMGEYGAGVVVYFDFLKAMMLLFVLLTLTMVAVMRMYDVERTTCTRDMLHSLDNRCTCLFDDDVFPCGI